MQCPACQVWPVSRPGFVSLIRKHLFPTTVLSFLLAIRDIQNCTFPQSLIWVAGAAGELLKLYSVG